MKEPVYLAKAEAAGELKDAAALLQYLELLGAVGVGTKEMSSLEYPVEMTLRTLLCQPSGRRWIDSYADRISGSLKKLVVTSPTFKKLAAVQSVKAVGARAAQRGNRSTAVSGRKHPPSASASKPGGRMLKVDIVSRVVEESDLTRVKATLVVNTVFDTIKEALSEGKRIELSGLGVFQASERKKSLKRNLKTAVNTRPKRGPALAR